MKGKRGTKREMEMGTSEKGSKWTKKKRGKAGTRIRTRGLPSTHRACQAHTGGPHIHRAMQSHMHRPTLRHTLALTRMHMPELQYQKSLLELTTYMQVWKVWEDSQQPRTWNEAGSVCTEKGKEKPGMLLGERGQTQQWKHWRSWEKRLRGMRL